MMPPSATFPPHYPQRGIAANFRNQSMCKEIGEDDINKKKKKKSYNNNNRAVNFQEVKS